MGEPHIELPGTGAWPGSPDGPWPAFAEAPSARSLSLRVDSELTTAFLRLVAGLAMLTMWLAGGFLRGHPGITRFVLPLAVVYAVVDLTLIAGYRRVRRPYPRALIIALTVLDNAIILLVCSLTGDVSSPAVAILLLVVTTNAARYGVRVAVSVAVSDSIALAVVCLVVPRPATSLHHRLQLLGWWSWLLVGGAVMAGVIARAALGAERARDVARRQVDDDRLLLQREREARRKLEADEADRRDFLRVVTHELRTPITSLGALARGLSRGADRLGEAERDEMLTLIQSHAHHLERLLGGVGDLATASVRTRPDQVVLSELALRELIVSAAHAGGLDADRLRIHLGPGANTVRSDSEKLRRILTNLMENAGRHSHGAIDVSATRAGPHLLLRVADRGPGLSRDVAARAFEKGFSFGPERGSSGLGLWIVRELAAVLGGRVWAEPRPGGGLLASVEIPIPSGQESRIAVPAPATSVERA